MHENKLLNDILEMGGRIVMVLLYFIMLRAGFANFLVTEHALSLIYIAMQALVIFFVIFRKSPIRISYSPFDWLVAITPTIMVYWIEKGADDNLLATIVQYSGAVILVMAVISLNFSLGVVPADRGIKTDGLYKYVRHPSFVGYITANTGILIGALTPLNFALVIVGSILQIWRALREEKLLVQNPEYVVYMEKTRWRLIPFVW